MKRMELEAVAFGEAASDLCAKVPGPISARPHASVKSAEPRWFKSFTGKGSQHQAGAVLRFTKSLDICLKLANVDPVHRVIYANWFLEDCAADYMHTAHQCLSSVQNVLSGATFAIFPTPGLVAWILMHNSGQTIHTMTTAAFDTGSPDCC